MVDSDDFRPLKGKKRQLSQFLVEEMMFDYVSGLLDDERKAAVEEYLKESSEAVILKENLNAAKKYCEGLASTQVSEPLAEKLLHSKSIWLRINEIIAWNKWPEASRWTLEAFFVSAVVAFIVSLSWPQISKWFPERQSDVILAEVDKSEKPDEENQSVAAETLKEGAPTSVTNVVANYQNSTGNQNSTSTTPIESSLNNDSTEKQVASVGTTKPTVENANTESRNTTEVASDDSAKAAVETTTPKPKVEKPKPKGFIYRAFMSLDEIDVVTEKIRAELIQMGGQKAGEVRMGWRRPTGSYFHFSIPESNYDSMVSMLRSFGPVQIAKDPHWRVMPEGKIRIILRVEDSKIQTN